MPLLLSLSVAFAHSPSFGMSALTARPEAPDEVWGLAGGWGVVHSIDAGATWSWSCEEAVGDQTLYDLVAWQDGVALVATATGVVRIGADCAVSSLGGLPEGFALRLARQGEHVWAAVIGSGEGGLATCDDTTCTPTAFWGAAWYPKTLVVDGGTVWVTLVHTDTLAAELYRSEDGVTFAEVYAWPVGEVDPRLLYAAGDTLLVWERPRDEASVPRLVRSVDGGRSFAEVLEHGYALDPPPGFVALSGSMLLGSWYGARTWRSADEGATFTEVSADAPAVRCGLAVGEGALVCTDHLADGLDVARTADGRAFETVACLEDATPAPCAAAVCDAYLDAWTTAAAYGGGACGAQGDTGDTGEAPPPCGCDAGAGGVGAVALGVAAVLARRQRPGTT